MNILNTKGIIMKTLPTHPSGYNLPLDLGDDSEDYSARELLTVRPFRSSWNAHQWGIFGGDEHFKPVAQSVAEEEIRSFLSRFPSTPTKAQFNSLVEQQLEEYCRTLGGEFMTCLIVLFGYDETPLKDVVSAHFEFEATILVGLETVRRLWVKHPTLGCNVHHVRDGGWGHLSHAWSGGIYVGGDPGIDPSSKGYVAHQMSPEALL